MSNISDILNFHKKKKKKIELFGYHELITAI